MLSRLMASRSLLRAAASMPKEMRLGAAATRCLAAASAPWAAPAARSAVPAATEAVHARGFASASAVSGGGDTRTVHAALPEGGRIVMLGCGSIGGGVLPLLLRHLDITPSQVSVIGGDNRGKDIAAEMGVDFQTIKITRDNVRSVFADPSSPHCIRKGDVLVNLCVDVQSVTLIELCNTADALYIDTCIEPWPGGYTDSSVPMSLRTNYALREQARSFARRMAARTPDADAGPTAVVGHGANPGLVSHFVKKALLDLAAAEATGTAARVEGVKFTPPAGAEVRVPASRRQWAALAQRLGVKVVHIAERDTQKSAVPKALGEFVNTWSIDGFVSEGMQPAELGWGTHERFLPSDASRHAFGCDAGIYLRRPGAGMRVRTWTPTEGHFHGFLITHNEAISIADYLTVHEPPRTAYGCNDKRESATAATADSSEVGKLGTAGDGRVAVYRPTVHYAYHPCDDAVMSLHEFNGKNGEVQAKQRLLMDEIPAGGVDELGVLLAGHGVAGKQAYWYGSQLSVDEARELAPYNNATSLQVTAAVLGGLVWALENPRCGVVEAEEMDHERVLDVAGPYLGPVVGEFTDWTPLHGRRVADRPPFVEDLDESDPWQFKNVRVL